MLGNFTANNCPAGSACISLAAACQGAALAMGLDYGGSESEAGYPKGCYRMTSSGKVFYNSHATGSGDRLSQPLCTGNLSSGAPQPAASSMASLGRYGKPLKSRARP